MTQAWVVQYDEGLYLFSHVDVAEQSIRDMYRDESCTFEREQLSDVAYSIVISNGERIQDRISIIAFDVHQYPTVIHRYVTEIDTLTAPKRPKREEF